MSFGGFLDIACTGGGVVVADLDNSSAAHCTSSTGMPDISSHLSMFSSPGLSLALQSKIDLPGEMMNQVGPGGGGFDSINVRNRDEDYDSRSGSDNNEGGGSGNDPDLENPPKRKKYHRHTPQQIQELEGMFKECPHPDEKQRLELSRRLGLETRQVKFWFQNRRTQMKTQLERHENAILRQENDKLRAENMSIRDAMRNPVCTNCGGPAVLGEASLEQQQLRIENARLKDELDRVCSLAGKFLGRPVSSLTAGVSSPIPASGLELGIGGNGFAEPTSLPPAMDDFVSASMASAVVLPAVGTASMLGSLERSVYVELALAAMDEVLKMVQADSALWVPGLGEKEALNYEEYLRVVPRCIGARPTGFVTEATRETGTVIINSLALVETLMDANRWADVFSCMIATASTTDVISSGVGGTRNGALQLMSAELQVLSPLVPIRQVNFLRFCKQLAEGVWVVVDVSVDDGVRDAPSSPGNDNEYMSCRKLPSGFVVQDLPNGYSKVTWVEHAEYDDSAVHHLYKSLLQSGMALGAQRWVATLQRYCQCLAILMSAFPTAREAPTGISPAGRRSMLKLSQRMAANFCAGVCASTARKWNKLHVGSSVGEDVRVMTRNSMDSPGEPPGVVLSACTSVWLPAVAPQRVFDFLRDERLRSEWDILSNGGPMQEMAMVAKGQDAGNCVSLLRASAVSANQSSMLILQETCTDASGVSLVVYAPVDVPAMQVVMSGGDSSYVALLPSGFAVFPDGPAAAGRDDGSSNNIVNDGGGTTSSAQGSLLTVAFQILVNSLPSAKLTVESVETVNNLISCTVQKIKSALGCDVGC